MVGRVGGGQKISIGRDCDSIRVVVHEIGELMKTNRLEYKRDVNFIFHESETNKNSESKIRTPPSRGIPGGFFTTGVG